MNQFMAYIRIREKDFAFRVHDEEEARSIAEFLKKKHKAITYELRISPVQTGRVAVQNQTTYTTPTKVQIPENVPVPDEEAQPYRVLVVEDEVDLREMLVEAFEKKGCTGFAAGNARSAQMLVMSVKPDLILSDVKMPGGDGIELFEAIKKLVTPLPVFIFMTAYEDDRTTKTVADNQLVLFRKPFDMMDMINQTLLASRKTKKAG